MTPPRAVLLTVTALLLATGGSLAALGGGTSAHAATTTLCQEQTAAVSGGAYTVQNNEFDSGAPQCVRTDGGTVTYDMTSPATSVSNLDIGTLARDMVGRGYTRSSWYLIDVEAGFELWQGGAGLKTDSFSVTVNGCQPGRNGNHGSFGPGLGGCSAARYNQLHE